MIRAISAVAISCALVTVGAQPAIAQSADLPKSEIDRSILPLPTPPFQGVIGKTYKDSKEAWPKLPTPPKGAPNIVVILLDDVGYGQTSTFG